MFLSGSGALRGYDPGFDAARLIHKLSFGSASSNLKLNSINGVVVKASSLRCRDGGVLLTLRVYISI